MSAHVFETRWPCRGCGRTDTVNHTEELVLVCLACGTEEQWPAAVHRLAAGRPLTAQLAGELAQSLRARTPAVPIPPIEFAPVVPLAISAELEELLSGKMRCACGRAAGLATLDGPKCATCWNERTRQLTSGGIEKGGKYLVHRREDEGPYLRQLRANGRTPLGVDYEIDEGEKEP